MRSGHRRALGRLSSRAEKIIPSNAMRFRKLRFAWSVVSGIACVLLIVLWVRSYWRTGVCVGPRMDGYCIGVGSTPGVFSFGLFDESYALTDTPWTNGWADAAEWWS